MKTINTRWLFGLLLFLSTAAIAQIQTGTLKGVVSDSNMMDIVPFANITLLKDNEQLFNITTDLDGNYSFANIQLGTYTILVSYVGIPNLRIENVKITAGITKKDIWFPKYDCPELQYGCPCGAMCNYITDEKPILEIDNVGGGRTYSAEEIRTFPVR